MVAGRDQNAILCLDQGGWVMQSAYPSNGRDWEAQRYGEWATEPERARPAAED